MGVGFGNIQNSLTSPTSSDVRARDGPRETIEDFRRAGLLRLLQPRRFGGHQTSVGLFLQIVEILAEGCAASAWAYGVLAELEWVIACLPERAQLDIWGDDQEALTAAAIVPRGVGVPAPRTPHCLMPESPLDRSTATGETFPAVPQSRQRAALCHLVRPVGSQLLERLRDSTPHAEPLRRAVQ